MIPTVISRFVTTGWRLAGLRILAPAVATLLLILQIQTASCQFMATGQTGFGQGSVAIAAFPICHSHSSDIRDDAGNDGPAPQHQGSCPFCLIHCNAHAPLIQTADLKGRTWSVLRPAPLPLGIIGVATLYPAGASPRGPPRVG